MRKRGESRVPLLAFKVGRLAGDRISGYNQLMLLVLALVVAAPPADETLMTPVTRTDLIGAFRGMIAALDGDQDGRLSHAEWSEAMARTGGSHSEADRASPIRVSLGAPAEEVFRGLVRDHDGQISFEEFVREPLASFDCKDADHDGIVQPAEDEVGRARCASDTMPQTPAATPVPAPAP